MPVRSNRTKALQTLKSKVEDAIQDESAAVPMYDDMARMASDVGAPNIAQTIRQIRSQEMSHYETFIEIKKRIDEELIRTGQQYG